jgi:hypothetical protein
MLAPAVRAAKVALSALARRTAVRKLHKWFERQGGGECEDKKRPFWALVADRLKHGGFLERCFSTQDFLQETVLLPKMHQGRRERTLGG